MYRFAATAAVLAILLASGCGSDDETATPGPTTTTTTPTTTTGSSAPVVKLASTSLGTVLVDGNGMTLYLFTLDTGETSACAGLCATIWPAFEGKPTGDGVDADDLGTITRDDGTVQASYYGHPLYHYAEDAAPGDVTGQGSSGKWYVIDAEGNAVTTTAATEPPTTPATSPTTTHATTTEASSRGGY